MTLSIVMVTLAVLLGLAFMISVLVETRGMRRTGDPSMAWLQVGLALSAVTIDAGLLSGTFGFHLPMWGIWLVFLLQDTVFAWRLWVFYDLRREARKVKREGEAR